MKKILILLFSSMLLLSQSAVSQVKKQFKDETFAQTTVIVKEDNADDADILNYLDLEDIGMGEQIRITTEVERPIAPKAVEPKPEEKAPVPEKAPLAEKTQVQTVNVALNTVDNSSKSSNLAGAVEKTEKNTQTTTKKKSTKTLKSTKKKVRKKSKRVKKSRKRFKKKKRKRSKRKYSCFKF